jgi:hypothetical protein
VAGGHSNPPGVASPLVPGALQGGARIPIALLQAARNRQEHDRELAEQFFQLAKTVESFEGVLQRGDVKLHVRTRAFAMGNEECHNKRQDSDRGMKSTIGRKRAAQEMVTEDDVGEAEEERDEMASKRARRSLSTASCS